MIKCNFKGDTSGVQTQQNVDMDNNYTHIHEDFSSFRNDSIYPDSPLRHHNTPEQKKVTLCALLSSVRFTMAALSSSLCYFATAYMEPILADSIRMCVTNLEFSIIILTRSQSITNSVIVAMQLLSRSPKYERQDIENPLSS